MMQAQRSRMKGVRVAAFVALGAFASWAGLANTIAEIYHDQSPATALHYAPHNANALAREADMRLQDRGPVIATPMYLSERKQIRAFALQSLYYQPANPLALRILGAIADLEGQGDKAAKLINLSERMSRRDLLAQLWLIENSVAENDIDAALRHYDIVIRAKPEMQNILFEQLSDALSEPAVRISMAHYITPNNIWLPHFLSYVVGQDLSPLNVARTIMLAGGMPDTITLRNLAPEILRRFGERGEYRYAREYYRKVIARGDGALASWGFLPEAIDPSHGFFAWRPATTPGLNGAFEPNHQSNETVFRALLSDLQPGTLLRKTLMLPPGRYKINPPRVALTSGIQAPALSWRLACLPENASVQSMMSAVQSSVQIDCDAQTIELRLDEPTGNQIIDISIAPPEVERALALKPTS